ncbi:MAG: hypothetical protein RLN88_05490 [Ekhidna sp.]|uniref:hypothetical protein n=1 Tax=Ekhidna sp. TaxID=2608089 RepID=UPI0032EEF94B
MNLTFSAAFLMSCSGDQIELPDKQLEGLINGEAWSYKSANAYIYSSDARYQVRFLSSKESVRDPCTLPVPSQAHVRAIFKPSEGSFFVSPQATDNNQVQVSFELSPSKSLVASSGFMEIYLIENQVMIGYLQAVLDDEENIVEGSFEIRICN